MLKMDLKKISQTLEKAKKTYSTETGIYNKFLENKTLNIPLGALLNDGETQQPQVQNYEQQPQTQNQPEPQPRNFGSQVNVIGDPGTGAPINIIAKNYINPDILDEDSDELLKKKETKSHKLSKIPDNLLKSTSTDWEPINYIDVDVTYDLYKLSKVRIKYHEDLQKIIYEIIEPELTQEETDILDELKKAFIYVFEKIAFNKVMGTESDLIEKGTRKLCTKYRIKLSEEQFQKITYYLERDFLGLELLEPVMHDTFIEDVSCDGLGIPIFVNHLKYGPLEVNRKYLDGNKLNSFIVKLAQKSNQEISLSKPILQGALPDGSRVEAIYGKEVSEKGSSYTIRKFRAEPFTPIHLIEFGTMSAFLLAYLWIAVENKQSILVSGGTATGKTTILNALSLFVPPTSKIVSIEDTPEINLPHEHWLPLIARETHNESDVTMFDLLKASLRERPDYIIVGEIRGAEAAILFQGMATGHAGLGTVHAEKFNDLVNRMTIAPINLPKPLLTELKIVIFMKQMKIKENLVRRVSSLIEVIDYDHKHDQVLTNEFLEYIPSEDSFNLSEKSAVIVNLLKLRGGDEEDLWKEIEKRRRILTLMFEKKIFEFRDVGDIFRTYYKNPSQIHDYIEMKSKKLAETGETQDLLEKN